jgi:ABC-2 type transport system permease protein
MRYVFLVALREYAENAKTKGFWIGILLFPVLLIAAFKVPQLLKEQIPTRYFIVIDKWGEATPVIDKALADFQQRQVEKAMKSMADGKTPTDLKDPRKRFIRVAPPADANPDDIETFRPYLTGAKKLDVDGKPQELFALAVFPKNFGAVRSNGEYWSVNLTDWDLREEIEDAVVRDVRHRMLEGRIDKTTIDELERLRISLQSKDPKKAVGLEGVTLDDKIRQWAPLGAVYLLWTAIFTVAQMLLNNTTEEKSTRVIEVLLSSVTPGELMFGKLLGIGAVGLTMVSMWILSFIGVLSLARGPEVEVAQALTKVMYKPELLMAFSGYFILGYFMYAGVFLAAGSIVNSIKEAQNLMGPIMLVMMVPLFTMYFVAQDPNGPLARVLSWIPFYTPFLMMNRAAASPPLFDIVGTLAVLTVTCAVIVWISGRIFRIGILRTGQPPKLLELVSWLRQK